MCHLEGGVSREDTILMAGEREGAVVPETARARDRAARAIAQHGQSAGQTRREVSRRVFA
jgi:hypothetical protein